MLDTLLSTTTDVSRWSACLPDWSHPEKVTLLEPQHAYVISGPSFVGKSTLGRSLKRLLIRSSARRTCKLELPAIRAMLGPITYDDTEDRLAYALLFALTRKSLELGLNVIAIAPCGAQVVEFCAAETLIAHSTQIQVRCSLETVLQRQVWETRRRRRAFVGQTRLRQIHSTYCYAHLPWIPVELEYDSELLPLRTFLSRLRPRILRHDASVHV